MKLSLHFLFCIIACLSLIACSNFDSSQSPSVTPTPNEPLTCGSKNVTVLNTDIAHTTSTFTSYEADPKLSYARTNQPGHVHMQFKRSTIFSKTYNAGVFYFAGSDIHDSYIYKFDQNTDTLTKANVQKFESVNEDHIVHNNILYFVAHEGTTGLELWKLDMADDSVSLVNDLNVGTEGSVPTKLILHDDFIYFIANGSGTKKLWAYDITLDTFEEITGVYVGSVLYMSLYNSEIYFATSASDIYKYTPATTTVSIVGTFAGGGRVFSDFTEYDNELYFSGHHPDTGAELYKVDPATGTVTLISDLLPGTQSSNPYNFYVFNNKLYLAAKTTNLTQMVSYNVSSDQVTVFAPSASTTSISYFMEYNGNLYYKAYSKYSDSFYKMSPLEVMTKVVDTNSFSSLKPEILGDELYFIISEARRAMSYNLDTDTLNNNPFFSAGLPNTLNPQNTYVLGDNLYMSTYVFGKGVELVRYNTITGALNLIADISTGELNSNPVIWTSQGTKLFFSAETKENGKELYMLDTATNKLTMLCDLETGSSSGIENGDNFKLFNGKIYFPGAKNIGLIAYNIANNTFEKYSISNQLAYQAYSLLGVGSNMYLTYNLDLDSDTGFSFLKVDSNHNVVSLEADAKFPFNDEGELVQEFAQIGDTYYYANKQTSSGTELWKHTNGTSSIVDDFIAGSTSFSPRRLYAYSGKLYFSGGFTAQGFEPAVYNPSTNSISLLQDLIVGAEESNPLSFTGLDDKLYIVAKHTNYFYGIYEHNITSSAMGLIFDLKGSYNSTTTILNLKTVNNKLYFTFMGNLFQYTP